MQFSAVQCIALLCALLYEKYSSATSDSTQVRGAEKLGSQVGRRIATSSGQTPALSLSQQPHCLTNKINFRATRILFLPNTVYTVYICIYGIDIPLMFGDLHCA